MPEKEKFLKESEVQKTQNDKRKTDRHRRSVFVFNEGGDSEWLINYLIHTIKRFCEQSVSPG